MDKEKELERQGRGLRRLSIFLIILAVATLSLLLDIYFVPSGTDWEEIKQRYADECDGKTDKEYWTELCEQGREHGSLTPSNIANWVIIKNMWNEEKQEEAERAKKQEIADEHAAELYEYFAELENDFPTGEKVKFNIAFWLSGTVTVNSDVHTDNDEINDEIYEFAERVKERVKTELYDKYKGEEASVAVIFINGKCVGVAFAPEIKANLREWHDYPSITEDGFDEENGYKIGTTNISKNGFIIGLCDS